jgi:hypothetical protein
MNKEHYDSFKKSLNYFFMANNDAVNLAMMLIEVCDTWDDIIDGDNPSADRVNKAFRMCLIDVNNNQFYASYQYELRPVIMSVILKWLDANELEKNKEHLEKAYMLRAGLYDLFAHIAYIIGGQDWYNQVGVDIRKLYGEEFNKYEDEIKCLIQ